MTMMKPNNGQLQSAPGQKMSARVLACQPLLSVKENKCRLASGETQDFTKKLVLQDAEIGEICKHARATTGGTSRAGVVYSANWLKVRLPHPSKDTYLYTWPGQGFTPCWDW